MEGKPVDAVRCDPPLIQGQVPGGGLVIGLDIVLLNGLQVHFQERDDFFIRHDNSYNRFLRRVPLHGIFETAA